MTPGPSVAPSTTEEMPSSRLLMYSTEASPRSPSFSAPMMAIAPTQ